MKVLIKKDLKGVTLIELLIALVVLGLTVAGIYRLFISQTKAYTLQDQIVEVQQGIRIAMDILLRDLRMAGFDDDSLNSNVSVLTPIIVGNESITVSYEYDANTLYTVSYILDNGTLYRELLITKDDGSSTSNRESLLENVDRLEFMYGVDGNDDKAMDDRNSDGVIDENDWITSDTVISENAKVVAVKVLLSARPQEINSDLKVISPRIMTSTVTLRNMCI